VTVHSLAAFDEVTDLPSTDLARRPQAEADFAAHQVRWDVADKEIGYSAALHAEREAADQAEKLLEVLARTPATSLAGVAAKLDALLSEGEPSACSAEFPWLQIRTAIEDIGRIARQTASGRGPPTDF
jgi:hypothetical protein